jgi:hypothetical protein
MTMKRKTLELAMGAALVAARVPEQRQFAGGMVSRAVEAQRRRSAVDNTPAKVFVEVDGNRHRFLLITLAAKDGSRAPAAPVVIIDNGKITHARTDAHGTSVYRVRNDASIVVVAGGTDALRWRRWVRATT